MNSALVAPRPWIRITGSPWPASMSDMRPRSVLTGSKRSASASRLSGGAVFAATFGWGVPSVLGQRATHALGHADRLLAALGLDGELRHHLIPAVPDAIDGHDLGLGPQPRPHRYR